MKKAILIGGGVLLVGGIAYLYFTNKKKTEALLSGGVAPSKSDSSNIASSLSNLTTDNVPKGTIITPSTDGGITPSVVSTPSQTKPSIQNQQELDRIMDAIKKNMDLSKKRQKSIASWKPSNAFRASGGKIGAKPSNPYPAIIDKLKADLLKLGYEYKESSTGGFLVKI